MSTATRTQRVNLPVVGLGAVLALLGFLSAILLGSAHGGAVPGRSGPTQSVVVAARDLSARTPLTPNDVTVVSYADGDVPPGALTKVDAAVGWLPVVDIRKGQPLVDNLLTRNPQVVGAAEPYLQLPKGLVAFTLPAGEQQAVGGYVQVGDRVDLVAVVTPKGGTTSNVRTIYTNVPVIRVGPAPDDVAGTTPAAVRRGGVTSSVTVAVDECQAEYLSWFIANASLRFALLSSADYKSSSDLTSDDQACSGPPKVVNDSDIRARWPGLA